MFFTITILSGMELLVSVSKGRIFGLGTVAVASHDGARGQISGQTILSISYTITINMAQGQLRENFFRVAERVESLSGIIDPAVPESLTYAQKVLVNIVSDLTNMAVAGQRLDSDTPGQESTLVTEIFGLLEQSKTLLGHIHRAVDIQDRLGQAQGAGAAPGSSNQQQGDADSNEDETSDDSDDDDSESDDSEDAEEDTESESDGYPAAPQSREKEEDRVDDLVAQNEAEPLTREEIGKLLVLTSRAFKSEIVGQSQRAFLKTQIIARHGMLRVVLQFPTLESIMAALKTISSSVDDEQ